MSVFGYTFGRVPDGLLFSDAGDRACRLYAVLTRWADLRPDEHPTRGDLAGALGCSVDSMDRAKTELMRRGYLEVRPRFAEGTQVREANDWHLLPGPATESDPIPRGGRTTAAGGGRTDAATTTSANDESAGGGGRTDAAGGGRTTAATQYRKREPEKEKVPPTAVPATAGPAGSNGEIALRNGRAMQAANGTLARLKAEVESGRRSWSLSEAATAEWLALLDDDHNLRAAQEFVMFYLGVNLGRESFAPAHWSMAGLRVRRWRGLVLHGVDEAITRVDIDEPDGRGRAGQPFWAYVEKVCQATHARNQEGTSP